ncbi:MAG: glycosyltransferase family 2 protein [Candidatus Delongbacteria bacterium]|nr:glycosyltransferase family 2 protein [Candidatus Delongbacteria bacterium]
MKDLSIVIPCYNEEESLYPLYDQIVEAVRPLKLDFEIILVDDGSTDQSPIREIELYQRDPQHIKIIQLRKNMGKAAALALGFSESEGNYVVTMDADLQDDPQEIKNLIGKLEEGYDLVSGWKKTRHDPLGKTLPSRLFNWVVSRMSGIRIHDFNCGLKIYRREVIQNFPVYGEMHRYLPVLAFWQGFRIGEIPVQHHARRFGTSKYGVSRMLKGFLDLLTIIFLNRYAKRPLHFFGAIGVGIGLIGMIINLYVVGLWIHFGNIQNRHPLLSLGILLTTVSIQFLSTGLLGELLVKMNISDEKKYPIKQLFGCNSLRK